MKLQKLWKLPLIFAIVCAINPTKASAQEVDQTVVEGFELDRYMGRWYEIARIENFFEKGMTHVTADYSIRDDGGIRVVNSGRKNSKLTNSSRGKARFADPDKKPQNGALQVSFFWNFYADYNILMLGENYSYALVGSGPEMLWILSRTPSLPQSTLQSILTEAKKRGYDTTQLLFVKQ